MARALKNNDPSVVTPRETLQDTIDRIDRGEIKPERMFIIFRESNPGGWWDTSYVNAGKDIHTTLGMIERAKHMILES